MKKYKPTSPGRRGMTVVSYGEVLTSTRNTPLKSLTKGARSTGGRNTAGRATTHYRGDGHKQTYRVVDFKYDKKEIPAIVETIEYDPFRSGFIALVLYKDGERRYVLAPKGWKKGDEFIVSEKAKPKMGNRMPLGSIPVGTFVFNIELKPNSGARIVRSAGSYGEVVAQDAEYTLVKLPSTEVRRISAHAWATIGAVSNEEYRLVTLGKAGRARHLGLRPKTRGSAKNTVDHPYGGGEGRAPRGHKHARTMQGRPTGKGQKTRSPKKYSNAFIVTKRKPGKLMGGKR